MKQVTVIGSDDPIPDRVRELAERLGRLLAERGAVVICGGKGGVMRAVCKGAKEASGLTVGIMPLGPEEANEYVDIVISTYMGGARNVINVLSGDAVISVAGGAGTLSEIGFALKSGKRVIALKGSGGVSDMLSGLELEGRRVIPAESVEEAVELALAP